MFKVVKRLRKKIMIMRQKVIKLILNIYLK